MRHTINLSPRDNRPPLSFDWDEDAGTVSGADAKVVQRMVEQAVRDGYIAIQPIPASVPATVPLRSREQMAAILDWGYVLPDWLQAHYPVPPEDPYIDDVPVVY